MNNNAQQGGMGGAEFLICGFYLVFIALMLVSLWKIFEKAGRPGWEGIIPIYNMYVLTCEIAKKEVIWFILMFIPCINIVASILIYIELAKRFGKSELFGIGLTFLGIIFFPILAFGDAQYQGGKQKYRKPVDDYDDDEDDGRPLREDEDDDRPRRRPRS